ncbi:MAG: DUF1570 domain-containing protein [Planctomycetota bacterium]|nr:DUF1570 domain-containing protein [Planctomycetota bacterium]
MTFGAHHNLMLVLLMSLLAPFGAWAETPDSATDNGAAIEEVADGETVTPPTEFDGIPLPLQVSGEDTIKLAEAILPGSFRRNRSSSHVVYTDSDWDSLTHIRNVLNRSWIEYRNFCRRMDVVVPRPDEKLVCIVFDQHDDFLEFALNTEGNQAILEHADGYFSPRYDWIVFFEPHHHQTAEEAYAQLDQQRDMLANERSGVMLRELPPEEISRLQSKWTWQDEQLNYARDNIEAWADGQRTTVAVHESIHQFTHVCHTWPGKQRWPIWLHEGLATSFETPDANHGFGPDQLNVERDYQFISCLDQAQLVDLRTFLSERAYGDETEETLRVLYPQSYGLVTWLYEYRKPYLAKFLKRLSAPPSEDGVDDPVALFEEIFGDIDALESRWHRNESTDWRTKRH